MEIKLENYITEEEIKEIVKEETRNRVQYIIKNEGNLDRIISNTYYKTAWKMIEEVLGEDRNFKDLITENVLKIINELTSYSVFRKKSIWEDESLGQTLLNQVIQENKSIIEDRIKTIFSNLNAENLTEDLQDIIYKVVEDRLIGKDIKQLI